MELFDAVRKLVNETTPPFGFVGNHDVVNWLVLNSRRVVEVLTQFEQKDLRPFQRGDRVKLKQAQPLVLLGQPTNITLPAGEVAVVVDTPAVTYAVIELTDRDGMRIVVELSNLERM